MGKPVVKIKRATIPRAGYEYQDLAGIEVLIRHYRDPDLYSWVQLEADDEDYKALDDIVAARKDGSYEFVQVKFTVDPDRYELDWDWLLEKSKKGTSMLQKWANAFARVSAMGPVHSAELKTNRLPSTEFESCLKDTRVDLGLLSTDLRKSVEDACGGAAEAKVFFDAFDFVAGLPNLDDYESSLRDQIVYADTDMLGWHVFRESVRRWAICKNHPEPDGRILREHVIQLITKRRPQPIRQDFIVPEGYNPPSDNFDKSIRERIESADHPITILWGTPGLGKSTYLSYLTKELENEGAAITRHHYFLSAEDSSSNRISFIEISTSLMDQLHVRHPKTMAGVADDVEKLRSTLETAAGHFADEGKRLFVVIDGLDHVWRDILRVDQLNHLFNELLPVPENVSLIIGTQRVPDEQLPSKLLTIANDDDWIEIPRMDEVAVYRWVELQDKDRPLVLKYNPTPKQRPEMVDKVAEAFFKISQGHPLHLIYAYETLINSGCPTSEDEIELLPPCPDGDIRTYYQGLWVRLGANAKNALHMLAGSDFFWPSLGIRQVLGDFSEIGHLLEPHNVGMVPFHASIFAWVRERPDHEEAYQALLPKIINWLANDAPEYWSWGWLWLAKAKNGDFTELLAGATRDWVVESLAKGWPDQQIEIILAAAEKKVFEDGDLPKAVSLRSLKIRVSNAREFQSRDFAAYRAVALSISDNQQQTLNLLDEVHDLSDEELTELARLGPKVIASETVQACCYELARRVNAWIVLRHRPAHEFTNLSDQLLAVSVLMDESTVRRTLNYVRGFMKPEPHVLRLIRLLGDAQHIDGLQLVRKTLRGKKWQSQRRLINDAIIRAASFAGADVSELVSSDKEPNTAFCACWFLWRDRNLQLEAHIPAIPTNLIGERYLHGKQAGITSFFYDAFWASLYIGLCANGRDYSTIHPGLGEGDLGWLPQGLAVLEEIANGIAKGQIVPSFSVVYFETADVAPVQWGASPEREYLQYRAFREALVDIAVDLHFLALTNPANTKVPDTELHTVRQSTHWSDEAWVMRNVRDRITLLEKTGAEALLSDEAKGLSETVTEFSERSERWTQIADMAHLYEDPRQGEYLAHAAECLVGYGWRKDLHAMDVLDAVVEMSERDPVITRARLDTLAPIIGKITEFTDGDETNHVQSRFITVVRKTAPERLPSLYEHYLSNDEHYYADECLIELIKVVDLETPEGAALARTFIDDRSLGALEERALSDPVAQALLEEQNAFLGRPTMSRSETKAAGEELSEREKEAAKVDATSFGYKDFAAMVEVAGAVQYKQRDAFMARWLRHWKEQGKALEALSAIQTYFDTNERTYNAEGVLDEAFLVSLAVEGKSAAYPWLVKAHIHRHGWGEPYSLYDEKVMARLRLAAQYYPGAWLQYIKDTSLPAPYYRRQRYSFVIGYQYLVRFLKLVGQVELADKITSAFVKTLVEEVREQPIPETPWFR